jgi:hypothetical protein
MDVRQLRYYVTAKHGKTQRQRFHLAVADPGPDIPGNR